MPPAACGHGAEVAAGRCWDCHLAHLRSTGKRAQADQLIERKRQLSEGRFDLKRLVDEMAAMYAEGFTLRADPDPDGTRRPPEARPRRHGRPER